jgi:hypothetical protein
MPLLIPSCVEVWVELIFSGNYKPHKLAIGEPYMNYFYPKPIWLLLKVLMHIFFRRLL